MPKTTMSRSDLVRASVDAFNRGDPAGYAAHYADDARLIGPFFPEPLVGRATIEQTAAAMAAAFPGMRWAIVNLLEDGHHVVCELHVEGTHGGPLPMPSGALPPTGRTVSFDVLEIQEFNDEGLVTEHREYMDPGALIAQLGATA